MEQKFISVWKTMRRSPEINGLYSNLTFAENDLKEFAKKGGMSMIIKVVGGVIEERQTEIELVNSKKTTANYDNLDQVQDMIEIVKDKCKLTFNNIFDNFVHFSLSDQIFI